MRKGYKAISTKHSSASNNPEYDWRDQVLWVRSQVAKDVAEQWMIDSRHRWADVWWTLDQFLRLADEYSRLEPSKVLGRVIFDVIRRSTACRLKGWLNVTDVVHAVKAKHKGVVAFDIFAAGVGGLGLPRDISFSQVTIPGKGAGGLITTVFV